MTPNPADIAERQVIAWYLIMQYGHPRRSLLRPEHFRLGTHRAWWGRALQADSGWTWADLEIPAEVVAEYDVAGLPSKTQIVEIERKIVERWGLRQLQASAGAVLDDVKSGKLSLDEAMTGMRTALGRARAGFIPRSISLREAGEQLVQSWIRTVTDKRQGLTLPMPLDRLNDQLGGWLVGTLWWVLGINSGHKTTLATQSAERVAKHLTEHAERGHALVWPMEDPLGHNVARYLARNIRGCDTRLFTRGLLSTAAGPIEYQSLIKEAGHQLEQPWTERLRILAEKRPTLSRVQGVLEAEVASGCKFAVIDFFQLIRPDDRRQHPLEHITEAAYELQATAEQLDIPIVCTVQTSQEAKKLQLAEGRRLSLGDLRGGSALGDAAFGTLIINSGGYFVNKDGGKYLSRPKGHCEWERDKGWVHIHAAKVKDGITGGGRHRVIPEHDLITDEEP